MIVNFYSKILSDNQNQNIVSFTAPLTFSQEIIGQIPTDVYECANPENNENIRIEVSGTETVTVFSGSSTLFFQLDKQVDNLYIRDKQEMYIQTHLKHFFYEKEKMVELQYDLYFQKNQLIGSYVVKMEIN